MRNRFLKICCSLAACFFVTTCNAAAREDVTSDADKGRRKLRIVRPTDRDALPVGYRVRIGQSGNHLRIVERVPARQLTEDDEVDGSLPDAELREPAEQVPVPRFITWRDSSYVVGSNVYMFRAGYGKAENIGSGQAVPVMLRNYFTYRSASHYPMRVKEKPDTGDIISESVRLAREIFSCRNLMIDGFISRNLILCSECIDYSTFQPPFLISEPNMMFPGINALYFLHKCTGWEGSHEFAQLLASRTRGIKTRTLVYINKNGRQFESQKRLKELQCAYEGTSGPVKVIVSYPLTKPLSALAVLRDNYMIFGCKEIRVVLEKVDDAVFMNVTPSFWDPFSKTHLLAYYRFLEFCETGHVDLGR